MKSAMRKAAGLLLAVLLLAGFTGTAAASTAAPGETATVTFEFTDILGLDGAVSVSGDAGHSTAVTTGMTIVGSGDSVHCYAVGGDAQSAEVSVQVTADASAAAGEVITVTFQYRACDSNGNFSPWQIVSDTVTIGDAAFGASETITPAPEPTPTPIEEAPEGTGKTNPVFPILLFLPFAGIIGLVTFMFHRKKRKETDATPLVDYDITDDT